MQALYTIGYQGADLDSLVATLQRHRIDCVLDVRERPASRKRGFSKTPLSAALARRGIGYRHERGLGTPKPLRDSLRAGNGDYAAYFAAFGRYLDTQKPLLQALAQNLRGRVALLCFERDVQHCHRLMVAQELARRTGITPRHLLVGEETGSA